jgi:hypothetical protein
MAIILYLIAGLEGAGAPIYPILIGKPRKPITGGDAVIRIALGAAICVALVIAAGRL